MSLDDHSHCQSCFKSSCTWPDACPMVTCDQECGAVFHWCKKTEHSLLCLKQKVPCINQAYGCPREMTRHELGPHLNTCPASVVCCPYEWNRWPIYSQERSLTVPFRRTNFHAQSGQLDVALAMRDQRILTDSLKVPRKLRQSLKDRLNHRSPAVPLMFRHHSVSHKDSLRNDEQGEVNEEDPLEPEEDCDLDYVWPRDSSSEHAEGTKNSNLSSDQSKDTSESPVCNGNDVDIQDPETKTQGNTDKSASHDSCNNSLNNNPDDENHASSDNIDNTTNEQIPVPPIPPPSVSLFRMLSLDLNVESITRYQTKPRSMYTFLCSQVFRRDQYPWHVKNMHAELFAGLNGWIQHRCPLSLYGCTHSVTRLCPNNQGSRVVFSPVLESFGVQPHNRLDLENPTAAKDGKDPSSSEAVSAVELTDLPFEVLEHVAEYLDGFSLNNLALTCSMFEHVCYSILKKKGVVLLQWEKGNSEDKTQWIMEGTLWLFPNSVTPVEKWAVEDLFSMSDHLQHCRYNERHIRTESSVQVMLPSTEEYRMAIAVH